MSPSFSTHTHQHNLLACARVCVFVYVSLFAESCVFSTNRLCAIVCLCVWGTYFRVSVRTHACACVCWHKRLLCALGVNWRRSFVNILPASLLVRNRAGKLMSVWFPSREREGTKGGKSNKSDFSSKTLCKVRVREESSKNCEKAPEVERREGQEGLGKQQRERQGGRGKRDVIKSHKGFH